MTLFWGGREWQRWLLVARVLADSCPLMQLSKKKKQIESIKIRIE